MHHDQTISLVDIKAIVTVFIVVSRPVRNALLRGFEINLSDQKLEAFLNDEIPHTPIDVALLDSGLVTCIEHRRVWRRAEEKIVRR